MITVRSFKLAHKINTFIEIENTILPQVKKKVHSRQLFKEESKVKPTFLQSCEAKVQEHK